MRHAGQSRARSGVSRSELVFLLGIAVVLTSIALPAREYYQRWQRTMMARSDLRSIVAAATRYHTRSGRWPASPSGDVAADGRFGLPGSGNEKVFNVLRAVEGPGNTGHEANTNRTIYLDVATAQEGLSGIDRGGEFLDPWGTPYQLVLDLNYNGISEASETSYGRVQGRGVLAWSAGPDRKSDTDDDLLSWKDSRSASAGVP